MSFFPSADPEDQEQTPYVDNEHYFHAPNTSNTLSMPTSLGPDDCVDYGFTSSATTNHGLPIMQAVTWPPTFDSHPQGLGLHYPVGSFITGYTDPNVYTQPVSTSFTWPADFTPTHTPVETTQGFRRHSSWSNSCDPPSTVHPSQLWEPFQPPSGSVQQGQPSPGRSDYSASSYQSTASSPFVSPATYGTSMSSPMVKSESEGYASGPQRLHQSPTVRGSIGVEARDFASPPTEGSQYLFPVQASASASFSDAGDVKPSMRPGYRRAFSAADPEEVQFQGRRKRSLTRPENASCSCDICGKLFQRCYNLKAHMETHDANRSIPNKCKHPGCGKRFVRRTDLLRHNESVHVRSRPFECARCHNTFARKDTLQRHLDDGCPMRPEVKKRPIKASRSRASPPIKEEPMPQTPESLAALSPAGIERLRRS